MSIYVRSWLFALWSALVLISFPWWLPLLRGTLGPVGLLFGAAFWLGHGLAALYLFACPTCGLSLFSSGKGLITGRSPIPRRRCGHCGRDHTAVE
ncbi:hypothetical protein GCM10007301_40680 [Azorhizobium oxalatiphilum]|uniref:Uncharacterized protein n=1 Tax=Azorhizobium oxalatiphilum TaxID=980631 RepID=A0A917FGA8_9HYPH|nr:hypothetical protein [Azorhizobium oxalatiphilum]GGF76659.1 hypothetical protein GCM10007301_40680 [Azorhizobium oxalatiphilum]